MPLARKLVAAITSALALGLALSGCARRPPRLPRQFDFISRFRSAVSSDPRDFLGVLIPLGGVTWRAFGGRKVVAIAGPRALFDCTLDPAVPAELELEPRRSVFLTGQRALWLDIVLNRTHVARLDVGPQPTRRRVRLPRAAIRRGLNTLVLIPSRTAPAGRYKQGRGARQVSLLFPTLALRLGPLPTNRRAWRVAHPAVMMAVGPERRRVLMQRRVRYYLRLPAGAHLRFGIGVTRAALAAVRRPVPFKITLKRGRRVEVIFRASLREVAAGRPGWHDFDLALAGEVGEPVEITFATRPLPPPSPVWGWATPVLVSASNRGRRRERNVLVVALDTVRADHLSCYGYEKRTTPTIDALAHGATLFRRATAQAPWTLPSFATLFTSRYPGEHGAGSVASARGAGSAHGAPGRDKPIAFLDYSFQTLPEYLKSRGYSTLAYVTNPYLSWATGLAQGFDTYVYRPVRAAAPVAFVRRWLERHRGERFFVFLHLNDAHEPTVPPRRLFERFYTGPPVTDLAAYRGWAYQRLMDAEDPGYLTYRRVKIALYDASLAYMDEQLAGLFATLKAMGDYQRTLIVVLSDHGEEFWDHAAVEKRYYRDYRGIWGVGHGHTLFRELLRVPLIIKTPRPDQPAQVDQAVGLVDLYPTIVEELGLRVPRGLSGRSLAPLLAGHNLPELPQVAADILYGPERYSIIYRGWHYIRAPEETDLYFDLGTDREERTPLLDAPPEVRSELERVLDSFMARLAKRRRVRSAVRLKQMDPELRRRLEALGYL